MNSLLLLFLLAYNARADRCERALKNLLIHYQNQNKTIIETRLDNITDKHTFLRAFIPYFYQRLFEIRESLPVFMKLGKYRGTIVGDAHVENFGVLINNRGIPKFTFNDYDDVAQGPLFLDVLRLSQSASYVSNLDQAKMMKAYVEGLRGESRTYSRHVEDLMKSSRKSSTKPKEVHISSPYGFQFKSKDEPFFILSENEIAHIEVALKEKFKNFKIHDSFRTMKESGGSAFLTRYNVLLESEEKIFQVEFKEITRSGVVKEWNPTDISNKTRVDNAMKIFLNDEARNYLDTTTLGDIPFQIRLKMKGNKGIKLIDLKKNQISRVIEDEFYVLGELHRKSFKRKRDADKYIEDLESVSKSDWEESLKKITKEIDIFYKQIK